VRKDSGKSPCIAYSGPNAQRESIITRAQDCGLFTSSGTLAILIAILLASIPREEDGSGTSARVILVVDVAKRLTAVVADDEACAVVFDVPRGREAAICHRLIPTDFPRLSRMPRRGRGVTGWRLAARVAAQSSDGIQQLHTVSKRDDQTGFVEVAQQTASA
jgi:hypothetical protein